MKGHEMILGYAEYDGSKYPFVYEKGILNLLPGTKEELDKQKANLLEFFKEFSNFRVKHEWISNEYIIGITSEYKKIIFITKGDCSNNNGFIQYEIQVLYEYQLDSRDGDLINGLTITADEIDCFFHPSRAYDSNITFDEKGDLQQITVRTGRDLNSTIPCGSYSVGDISVSVEITAYTKYSVRSEVPISAHSQIYFEFDKAIDLDKALEIIFHLKSFLRYICYRKNINLSNINVFSRNEEGLRSINGKIHIISEEVIELNKKKKEQLLTFDLLEGQIITIFQAIADGRIYFEHICNCIEDKKSYDVARIILIFAAFEREYNNCYSSKPTRSEQYLNIKADILSLLGKYEKECSNGKARKYIKGFKKIIDSSDNSLSERIKNAINSNLEIIKVFLNYNYQADDENLIEDISQRMNIMRNNIAHGNLDLVIEAINLSDFKILEILVYVMRLNTLNISTVSIKKAMCKLFGFNIHIQDTPKVESATKLTD